MTQMIDHITKFNKLINSLRFLLHLNYTLLGDSWSDFYFEIVVC